MKTTIYYFSGTGNSLYVARKLAEKINNATLISIPKTLKQERITTDDAIGIVCPIYMYNMPHIVADFIKKIKKAGYIFFVFTGGGETGNCMKKASKIFKRNSLRIAALFNIKMPSNYTPFGAPDEETIRECAKGTEIKIDEIAAIVNNGREYREKATTGFFKSYIYPGFLYELGYAIIPKMDQSFAVDEKCNGCGVCSLVCPVNNIDMTNNKPLWNQGCQQCFACLQWCSQKALQYGKKTADTERYTHPAVRVKDVIDSACDR